MDYEKEIKKHTIEKDIYALMSAESDMKRKAIEARKALADVEARAKEYRVSLEQKQAELALL